MSDVIKAMIAGTALGAFSGFAFSALVPVETWLFAGEWIVAGAMIGGICGLIWGDDFLDWVKAYWRLMP